MRRGTAAILLLVAGVLGLLVAALARAADPLGSCAWARLQAVDRLSLGSPGSSASYAKKADFEKLGCPVSSPAPAAP